MKIPLVKKGDFHRVRLTIILRLLRYGELSCLYNGEQRAL